MPYRDWNPDGESSYFPLSMFLLIDFCGDVLMYEQQLLAISLMRHPIVSLSTALFCVHILRDNGYILLCPMMPFIGLCQVSWQRTGSTDFKVHELHTISAAFCPKSFTIIETFLNINTN